MEAIDENNFYPSQKVSKSEFNTILENIKISYKS